MSEESPTSGNVIRTPAHSDVEIVRYVLPGSLVRVTGKVLEIRTCKGGTIAVPRSILAGRGARAIELGKSGTNSVVIEAEVRRDVAQLLGSMIAEIVRITNEIDALEKGR